MIYIAIAPTTTEATSKSFSATSKNNIGICCNLLSNAEVVTLQIYDSANDIWADAKCKSELVQLSITNNFISIYEDTNTYRIKKSVTTVAVGVNLTTDASLAGFEQV